MHKLDTISKSTLLTEESRSARLSPKRPPREERQVRKISFDDFQSTQDRLFGVFNLEEYNVIRGFIPGKSQSKERSNVRLHYTRF